MIPNRRLSLLIAPSGVVPTTVRVVALASLAMEKERTSLEFPGNLLRLFVLIADQCVIFFFFS
jgi:hypothetical protein